MLEALTIFSSDRQGRVCLTPLEFELDHYPSVQLDIAASDGLYSVESDSVWVPAEDLSAFIAALRSLERTRTGECSLRGSSPDRFFLRFFFHRPVTSLALGLDLHSHSYREDERPWHRRLSLEFPLDQSFFHEWLSWFAQLERLCASPQ